MSGLRHFVRVTGVALLLCLSLWAGREFREQPGEEIRADQLIVKLKPGVSIAQVLAALPPQAKFRPIHAKQNLHRLSLPPGLRKQISAQLAASDLVEYVEPDRIRHADVQPPNDSSYGSQWDLQTIHAVQAWSLMPNQFLSAATPSAGRLKIAVLDTGADCQHPDFMNAGGTSADAAFGGQLFFASSEALVPTTLLSPACPWQDDHGHGTHTAGTIAAATQNATGVASLGYPVTVVSYKILDVNGNGYDTDLAQAIMDATDAGVQVISMSLGGAGYSQSLQDAANYAWQGNVVIVAASGNSNSSALVYPAGGNHVIGVAATDSLNNRASFSNFGKAVDIAAPGVNILSTMPSYPDTTFGLINYGALSGTSMATPHISAAAGLVALTTPGVAADAIGLRLQQSAGSPDATGGWNQYLGYGILDAFAAVKGTLRPATVGGVVGQVVDGFNLPVSGALVSIGAQSFTTTGDGLFRIANLPAGLHDVTSSAAGYPNTNLKVMVVPGADSTLTIPMGGALGEFTGSVTAQGVPVAGAVVQAIAGNAIQAAAFTGADGSYSLWVPPGTYDLRMSAISAYSSTVNSQTVSSGGTVFEDLVISKLGMIGGTVTDSAQAPVASAQIAINGTGGVTAGATTDASGHFQTIGLPAGAYSVTASATGKPDTTVTGVPVAPDVVSSTAIQFPAGLFSIKIAVATVTGGSSITTNSVTLGGPAPPGGMAVTLASSDSAAASVPASVTVPEGAISASFTIAAHPVSSQTLVTISASTGAVLKSGTLTVLPPAFSSLALSPTSTGGGNTTALNTAYLNAPAPANGVTVSLSSSNAAAAVPASVTIPAGATSVKFTITTSAVAASTPVTTSGSSGGVTKTAVLTLLPVAVSSVALSPAAIAGGNNTINNLVYVNAPAPANGVTVSLSSSNPAAASVPVSVTIPAGTTSVKFTITTTAVASSTPVTISAAYSGVTKTAILTLSPITLSSIALSPVSTAGGNTTVNNLVYVNAPAPVNGVAISLSSSNASASLPATVTVPAGATSVKFTITTSAVAGTTPVTISASAGGVTKTAVLTLTPVAVSSVALSPATFAGGNKTTTNTVYVNAPAPAGGLAVSLSSSNPSVASIPDTMTVPAGATSVKFTITTGGVDISTPVTISASGGGVSKTAVLTLTPVALSSVALSPITTAGGNTTTSNVVYVNGPAPAGILASLSSSNAAASVPASVTVPAGATSVKFTITTTAVGSSTPVTISASYAGVTKTAILTLTPVAVASVALSPATTKGGSTTTGNVVYINAPAPAGGMVVALFSSNPAAASVPGTVTVPTGATYVKFTITTVGVAGSTPVTISGSCVGVTRTAILTLTP